MKKLLMALALVCSFAVYAQNKDVDKADKLIAKNKVDKAFEAFKSAEQDPAAMNDSKTWLVKGKIYTAIAGVPVYSSLVKGENPAMVAMESFKKAIELDPTPDHNLYKLLVNKELPKLKDVFSKIGGDAYMSKQYERALENFQMTLEIADMLEIVDTVDLFNASISATGAGNSKAAQVYLLKLVEYKYSQPSIYNSLANTYIVDKDYVNAAKYAKQGLTLYPDDKINTINAAGCFLRMEGKEYAEEAEKILNQTIEKWPGDKLVYLYIGIAYDQMGKIEKAENAYMKAVELDPAYFDAILNLALVYVNAGNDYQTIANNAPLEDEKAYYENNKLANEYFAKSIPVLETVIKIQPDNCGAIITLRDVYNILQKNAEAKKLTEIIETKCNQ